MLPAWFFWLQVVTCFMAALVLFMHNHTAFAWTWLCYSLANLGFVYGIK